MNTIKGKVIDITRKSGDNWERVGVVLLTDSKYNNTIPVDFFNKKVDVKIGDHVEAKYYLGGREYQGRYFPVVDGMEISVVSYGNSASSPQPDSGIIGEDFDEDSLPF